MGTSKISEAAKLACIRQNIITYCEGFPDLIRVHGSNSVGALALNLGKCFLWIGPTLDEYYPFQPLPGIPPLPRVCDLGEQLRVVGLETLHRPGIGELAHTVEVLKRQIETLRTLATMQAESERRHA